MYTVLLWTSEHFPKICKPLVVCQFYCMALFFSQTQCHVIKYILKTITCDINNDMDHPDLIVSNFMEKSIDLEKVK